MVSTLETLSGNPRDISEVDKAFEAAIMILESEFSLRLGRTSTHDPHMRGRGSLEIMPGSSNSSLGT